VSTYDPNANLYALRCKVERWLFENGEFIDEDRTLAANNLTLWASMFLSVTHDEAEEAAEQLRREGAIDFIDRVRATVCGRLANDGRLDPVGTVAQAYSVAAMEVLYDG
jgi:hypothetical protein